MPATVRDYSHKYAGSTISFTDGSVRPQRAAPRESPSADTPTSQRTRPPTASCVRLSGTHTLQTVLLSPTRCTGPNLVNHAELTAITHALEATNDAIIATDSLVCIHQLRGYLQYPRSFLAHPLLPLLTRCRDALCARASLDTHTSIIKVPAHRGILGNEIADWTAGHADLDTAVPIPAPTHLPPYWVHTLHPISDLWQPIHNLGDALLAVLDHYRLGSANTDGVYYKAYQHIAGRSHASSNYFLTYNKLSWGATRLALRYRGGGIYNRKIGHRWGKEPTANCPLCLTAMDGQSHMLGGCTHPTLRGMYVNRHNEATAMILGHVRRWNQGAGVVQADIGSQLTNPTVVGEAPPPTDDPLCSPERPTAWVPPPSPAPSPMSSPPRTDLFRGVNRTIHDWLATSLDSRPLPRPDITLVAPPRHRRNRPNKVFLIELKFGQDTLLETKHQPASDTLETVAGAIRRRWPHAEVAKTVLLLGVGGRIPTLTVEGLTTLGVPAEAASRLANRLNVMAVSWLHRIIVTRRKLEFTLSAPAAGP